MKVIRRQVRLIGRRLLAISKAWPKNSLTLNISYFPFFLFIRERNNKLAYPFRWNLVVKAHRNRKEKIKEILVSRQI